MAQSWVLSLIGELYESRDRLEAARMVRQGWIVFDMEETAEADGQVLYCLGRLKLDRLRFLKKAFEAVS